MLDSMGLLFASFWRAAAYCARPRVIAMSLLPLLLMGALALGLRHFYWRTAVLGMQTLLESSPLLTNTWRWLEGWGLGDVTSVIAPLMVVLFVTPVLVVVSLFAVAVLMTPALVSLVAARRFPHLDRKNGGSFLASVVWQVSSTVLALIALVVSMPLWLVPPLVLVLPPLIWGWLTYRVMAFDALAEHASKQERQELFRRHRSSLLGIGILTGYLGAAPALVWASGVIFVAAFFVLIPLAIWIYTLVFAFSSLWFAHFSLDALQSLRAETLAKLPGSTHPVSTEDASAAPPSLAPSASTSPLLVSPDESANNGPPTP